VDTSFATQTVFNQYTSNDMLLVIISGELWRVETVSNHVIAMQRQDNPDQYKFIRGDGILRKQLKGEHKKYPLDKVLHDIKALAWMAMDPTARKEGALGAYVSLPRPKESADVHRRARKREIGNQAL